MTFARFPSKLGIPWVAILYFAREFESFEKI